MTIPMTAALEARGLYHIYRRGYVRTVVLRGVDVVLQPHSWTTVMGPSGSGKSTFLHILAGLIEHLHKGTEEIDRNREDCGRVILRGNFLQGLQITQLQGSWMLFHHFCCFH